MLFTGIIIIAASITGLIIIGALRTEKVAPNFRFVFMYNYRRVIRTEKVAPNFWFVFMSARKLLQGTVRSHVLWDENNGTLSIECVGLFYLPLASYYLWIIGRVQSARMSYEMKIMGLGSYYFRIIGREGGKIWLARTHHFCSKLFVTYCGPKTICQSDPIIYEL